MSAAKCVCMGSAPGVAPPLSMGMASRQFNMPPCPCLKCKDRARRQHEARVQEVANNKLGICSQINKTPPGVGSKDEPCMCAGQRMGPNMGPPRGQGMGAPKAPGMVPGIVQGTASCMPSSSRPGPAIGPGKGPGMTPRSAPGMGPGTAPGRTEPQMEPVMPSNRTVATQGCTLQKSDDDKCQCLGAQEVIRRDVASDDSTGPTGIIFGGEVTLRKSSVTQSGYRQIFFPRPGCAAKDYDDFNDDDDDGDMIMANVELGRDTFGSQVILQGNAGLLNAGGACHDSVACDESCGFDTGCNDMCRKQHAAAKAGWKTARANDVRQRTSAGIRICSNEYINMILTFLMEVLGILVFFAVCTITFWITLGYYIVQLLIDLKNADRNVHVAIGTVLSLLLLAFAITLVTHGEGNCRQRAIAVRKGIESTSYACSKCQKAATAAAKRTCVHKCKASAKPKLKPQPPIAKSCAAKLQVTKPKSKPKAKTSAKVQHQKSKSKVTRSYSDCQGRAIFERSRRNSILIEMKQPPTWLIWLRDSANDFFSGH